MRYVFALIYAAGSIAVLAGGSAVGLLGLAYAAYLAVGSGSKLIIY